MRRILILVTAAVLAALFATAASADQDFHTMRLQLSATGGAPGVGWLVNIHANGPQVYAHEIYTLRGAVPGSYAVAIHGYPTSLDCTGELVLIPTTTFTTNALGNGRGDAVFTPEIAAPFRGRTFSIIWTAVGPATYKTGCIVVTLD